LLEDVMKGVKAALVGDSGAGKTTIHERPETGRFKENPPPTVGSTFTRIEADTTDRRWPLGQGWPGTIKINDLGLHLTGRLHHPRLRHH
jgi:GTPase SAR1 family protein